MRYLLAAVYLAELEHNILGNKAGYTINKNVFAKQNEVEGKQICLCLDFTCHCHVQYMDGIMSRWLS